MKNILFITSHFPPSNLTCVHRSRYLVSHLDKFGWNPIVLTSSDKYYENDVSDFLFELLKEDLNIIRTKAISNKFFKINDLGVRSFFYFYSAAKKIIESNKIDFIYITIPSNFIAPLGHLLYKKYKIPFAIDFQDPWVHRWDSIEKIFSKAWFSYNISKILEPFSLKNVSFISSVSKSYYKDILNRYDWIDEDKSLEIPIGIDDTEFNFVKEKKENAFLFQNTNDKFNFIYAGAFLPKSYEYLKLLFSSLLLIKENHTDLYNKLFFTFVGTGTNSEKHNISNIAKEFGISEIINEHKKRIDYSDVINHLINTNAILVLGSSEKHYSPSKIYQSISSNKPIFAIMNKYSPVNNLISKYNKGTLVEIDQCKISKDIIDEITKSITSIISNSFDLEPNSMEIIYDFQAENIAKKFAKHLDSILKL